MGEPSLARSVTLRTLFVGDELANAPLSALEGVSSGLAGFQANTVDGAPHAEGRGRGRQVFVFPFHQSLDS